jgi:putative hemolysin
MNALWESSAAWLPGVLAMGVLCFASGFYSCSETALFFLSRDEVRAMQVGRPRQRLIAHLLRTPDRLLTAILFWNLVVNLTYFTVSLVTARRLVDAGHPTAAGLFGLVSVALIIALGEVLPKSLAVLFPRRLAELVVWPISLCVRLLDPLMPVLTSLSTGIRRAIFPHLKREAFLDADDMERALESLPADQNIVPYERTVLHRILDLSEMTAEEIMRPRGTYRVWTPPVALRQVRGNLKQFEYILIRDDQPESIRGAVPLAALATIPEERLETHAVPVFHVPWCATVADILEQMQERMTSVAVVVSEYGESVGIVTEEDILDSILAQQPSRGRRLLKREPVLAVGEGTWHVEGITTLRYLATRLELDFDPDEDESVTVGGLFQHQLERFPRVGDECLWRGHRLRVFEAPGRGQLRVVATRLPPADPSAG